MKRNDIDVEGTTYEVVIIDNKLWTTENLRTTKDYTGMEIPYIYEGDKRWEIRGHAGRCGFDNAPTPGKLGYLYNWNILQHRSLSPNGWRLPSIEEWMNLEITSLSELNIFLGGIRAEKARKIKSYGRCAYYWANDGYIRINQRKFLWANHTPNKFRCSDAMAVRLVKDV